MVVKDMDGHQYTDRVMMDTILYVLKGSKKDLSLADIAVRLNISQCDVERLLRYLKGRVTYNKMYRAR